MGKIGLSAIICIFMTGALLAQTDDFITRTAKQKRSLDTEYAAGSFTFAKPFVRVNPFGNNSLVAELRFRSSEPMRIRILVQEADGSYYERSGLDETYHTEHRYAVLGLYAGKRNNVTLLAETEQGTIKQSQLALETQVLPAAYPQLDEERFLIHRNETQLSNGFYHLMMARRKLPKGADFLFSAIDTHGRVRWLNTELKGHIFIRTARQTMLVSPGAAQRRYHSQHVYELDEYGQYLDRWDIPNLVHHDAYILPNGNVLFLSSSGEYLEDTVIEYDTNTRAVVREWNVADYVPLTRQPMPSYVADRETDWAHLNAFDYDPLTDVIIASLRNQAAIVAFERASGKLLWISGPHENWQETQKPYLLQLLPSSLLAAGISEWHWAQHCVRFISPTRVLIFDNGRTRSFDPNVSFNPAKAYSRVVEYVIDADAKTAQQVWEFGRQYGNALYTSYISGIHYLAASDSVFINFGGITKTADGTPANASDTYNSVQLFEVTHDAAQTVLFELSIQAKPPLTNYGYRAYRAFKYADLAF